MLRQYLSNIRLLPYFSDARTDLLIFATIWTCGSTTSAMS